MEDEENISKEIISLPSGTLQVSLHLYPLQWIFIVYFLYNKFYKIRIYLQTACCLILHVFELYINGIPSRVSFCNCLDCGVYPCWRPFNMGMPFRSVPKFIDPASCWWMFEFFPIFCYSKSCDHEKSHLRLLAHISKRFTEIRGERKFIFYVTAWRQSPSWVGLLSG